MNDKIQLEMQLESQRSELEKIKYALSMLVQHAPLTLEISDYTRVLFVQSMEVVIETRLSNIREITEQLDNLTSERVLDTECVNIETLVGKVAAKVHSDDESVTFEMVGGAIYVLCHTQLCCENVYVEDICGDLDDLVGSVIYYANEVSSDAAAASCENSATWTFYNIGTNKGSVTIRWLGMSNGYYSESVNFIMIKEPTLPALTKEVGREKLN